MKMPKLLLSLVMILIANAATVASADVNGPYISGHGAGFAVLVVGGSDGVFVITPDGLSGSVNSPSQVGTVQGIEMEANASGIPNDSSWYESRYSITIPAGKTATAHYTTYSSNGGSSRATIDGVTFSGNTSSSLPLSSGNHSFRVYSSASYQGQSGSASIIVLIN